MESGTFLLMGLLLVEAASTALGGLLLLISKWMHNGRAVRILGLIFLSVSGVLGVLGAAWSSLNYLYVPQTFEIADFIFLLVVLLPTFVCLKLWLSSRKSNRPSKNLPPPSP